MSCCGSIRAAQRSAYQSSPRIQSQGVVRGLGNKTNMSSKPVHFEYIGMNAINVTGPATGTAYRFERRGARVLVYGADAASLLAVPGLRPIG